MTRRTAEEKNEQALLVEEKWCISDVAVKTQMLTHAE
jgi:hypothetical protein